MVYEDMVVYWNMEECINIAFCSPPSDFSADGPEAASEADYNILVIML